MDKESAFRPMLYESSAIDPNNASVLYQITRYISDLDCWAPTSITTEESINLIYDDGRGCKAFVIGQLDTSAGTLMHCNKEQIVPFRFRYNKDLCRVVHHRRHIDFLLHGSIRSLKDSIIQISLLRQRFSASPDITSKRSLPQSISTTTA